MSAATGKPLPHDAARGHVTGGARYVDDIPTPAGTLHLAFGLSGIASGRILSMDLEAVRAAPGVEAVLIATDLPHANDVSPSARDEPLLATGTVHYVGQPLFIVVATSHLAARHAARLGAVEIAEDRPVLTIDDALAADTRFEDAAIVWTKGNVDAALKDAAVTVEGSIDIGGQEHFYLEGQAALALPQEAGDMTVHSSTQHPTEIQHKVADALGVPLHAVRVEVRRMGGGFGGKESQGNALAVACAVAARATGRPCKMRYDRDDDMIVTGKRHDFRILYRAGADADGRLSAVDFTHYVRCGWAQDLSLPVADRAMLHADNAYLLPAARITSHRLRTNTQSATAFRGFGGPQGVVGVERVMDHLAHALGRDGAEVRKLNYYREMAQGEGEPSAPPPSAPPEDIFDQKNQGDLASGEDLASRGALSGEGAGHGRRIATERGGRGTKITGTTAGGGDAYDATGATSDAGAGTDMPVARNIAPAKGGSSRFGGTHSPQPEAKADAPEPPPVTTPANTTPPNTTPYGMQVTDFVLHGLTERLLETSHYATRRAEITRWNAGNPVLKRGIAFSPVKFGISFTLTHLNQAGALVHVYQDGSVQLNHGGTEMGQGLFRKVAQVAAGAFGIDIDAVRITATDTGKVPNTSATAASSGTDLNGMAVLAACEAIRDRIGGLIGGDARFEGGKVITAEKALTWQEAVAAAYLARVSLSATGFYATPGLAWDRVAGDGTPFFYFAQGAAVTEVVIDTLTGENRILRTDILHDAGRSLNPAIDVGQIEGGYVQGAGWLTTEELVWDDKGRLRTHAPSTYKIPACSDRPEVFNVTLWDAPNPAMTIGRSKAVGEPPLMLGVSAFLALGDAIAACGTAWPDLQAPATAQAVLAAVGRARA